MANLRVLIQQEHLDDEEINKAFAENPCHIYAIARRPRIILDPDSVAISATTLKGELRVQTGFGFESFPFTISHSFGTADISFSCPFPHTAFTMSAPDGRSILAKTAVLPAYVSEVKIPQQYLDLEVLYIGQSYGVEGARTAPVRLKSHSTLQGIYSEALQRSPDKEIWLLLMSFHPPIMLTTFDGISKTYGTSMDEDDAHIEQVLSGGVTEQQQINFTEAALIKYFQPPYNSIYKDHFPNPAHQTYSQCYDLEINAVSVELQTDDLGFQLWSEAVSPQWVHLPKFPLYSREDRLSIFELPTRTRPPQTT